MQQGEIKMEGKSLFLPRLACCLLVVQHDLDMMNMMAEDRDAPNRVKRERHRFISWIKIVPKVVIEPCVDVRHSRIAARLMSQ